ncbi:MAG: hypothetical protein LBD46_03360 [Endomicrobium sp.]|jgi:hypothetical protein|nr:hypothetical protein [Endomicrobium sp.]
MDIGQKQNARVLPNSSTVWKAQELNQITAELKNIIIDAGLTTDENILNQVLTAINQKINAAAGGSLTAKNFDSAQPTQEELTLYACQDIFGAGGTWTLDVNDISQSTYVINGVTHTASEVWNKTWVTNLFNSGMWQLVDTPNTPTPIYSWQFIGFVTAVAPLSYIGEIKSLARTDTPEGLLRLYGGEYTRSMFPNFYDNYLLTNIIPTGTYTQWETAYNNNSGNVGFVGVDSVNQKFKMPRLDDRVAIMQCLTIGNIGQYGRAQIVNITGHFDCTLGGPQGLVAVGEGAFRQGDTALYGSSVTASSSVNRSNRATFDTSRVVNTGDRFQPRHIQFPLMMVVSNTVVPASQANYNVFIDGLANKASLNLDNITTISTIAQSLFSTFLAKLDLSNITTAAKTKLAQYSVPKFVYSKTHLYGFTSAETVTITAPKVFTKPTWVRFAVNFGGDSGIPHMYIAQSNVEDFYWTITWRILAWKDLAGCIDNSDINIVVADMYIKANQQTFTLRMNNHRGGTDNIYQIGYFSEE